MAINISNDETKEYCELVKKTDDYKNYGLKSAAELPRCQQFIADKKRLEQIKGKLMSRPIPQTTAQNQEVTKIKEESEKSADTSELKQVKRALNVKYKDIRDSYLDILSQLKANVTVKKSMRAAKVELRNMATACKDGASPSKKDLERIEQIKTEFGL